MFPNVRLMTVAMLASIVAMSCGLGAFAALRVNHDSLARLPAAGPPLRFVFNTAPAAITDATPASFGVRFAVTAPPFAGAAIADTSPPDQANRVTWRDANTDTAAIAATEHPADDALSAEGTTSAMPSEARSDVANLDLANPDSAQAENNPPAVAKSAVTATHKASRRRRLALTIRRSRQTQATAGVPSSDQNAGYLQPNFQFGSSGLSSQPAKNRSVVRTVNKTTTATSAVGGPFVRPESQ
jgi:hypothetical protein